MYAIRSYYVLEQVSRFSGFSRYGGVMPMHLLALREDVVESLVHNGILAQRSSRAANGCRTDGVCLTDLGRRLLVTR